MTKDEKAQQRRKTHIKLNILEAHRRSTPLETCELPPEIEALQHYAERVELDDAVERLSITTF